MKSFFVLSVLLIGADFQRPDLSLESSPLDGSWELVSVTCPGSGQLFLATRRWTFSDTQWTYHGSNFIGQGTCKFGLQRNLQTIDMADISSGGYKLCGIWKFQGDKLMICHVLNSDDRPTNFHQKGVILTFKRVTSQ